MIGAKLISFDFRPEFLTFYFSRNEIKNFQELNALNEKNARNLRASWAQKAEFRHFLVF